MEDFIVSARKYRPMSFDTVVGQGALTMTLKNAVKSGKLAHAYLFCGPRGVGKTKQITSEAVSDEQMAHAADRFPINPPKNKEEYYYRSIFAEHFPSDSAALSVPSEASVACSTAIALEWDAAFKGMNDPSGRAVKGVHESAY